jgi:hypothetical protein
MLFLILHALYHHVRNAKHSNVWTPIMRFSTTNALEGSWFMFGPHLASIWNVGRLVEHFPHLFVLYDMIPTRWMRDDRKHGLQSQAIS